jgi:hypothetical protein
MNSGTNISANGTNVTVAQLGYLNSVTSSIQTQLDNKANLSGATFTGYINCDGGARFRGAADINSVKSGQGAYIHWNTVTSEGYTDFINNRGSGVGAFRFYNISSASTTLSPIVTIDQYGGIIASSSIQSSGTFSTASTNLTLSAGTGTIKIDHTTVSTDSTKGALVIGGATGGLGVAGNINCGSTISGSISTTSITSTGSINFNSKNLTSVGDITSTGTISGSISTTSITSTGSINFNSKNLTSVGDITSTGTIQSGGTFKTATNTDLKLDSGSSNIDCDSNSLTKVGNITGADNTGVTFGTSSTGTNNLTLSASGNVILSPGTSKEIQCSTKNITGVGTNITGSGALTITSGGTNQDLTFNTNGTGKIQCSGKDIAGVGSNITGSGILTIASGGTHGLSLNSASGSINCNGDSFTSVGNISIISDRSFTLTTSTTTTTNNYDITLSAAGNVVLNTLSGKEFQCGGRNITGAGTITGTSFNATSDRRVKANIASLDSSYTVDNLKPVSFFNTITNKNDIGFIAQDVEDVYPFMVSSSGEYKSLNYISMIGILVKEIQDLKKEISDLKNK